MRALLFAGALLAASAAQALDPNEIAPEIVGKSLFGDERHKLSDWKGKTVIVDFWASWCGPCILSMPELDAMRERLHKAGFADRFEVLGVNLDDDPEKARVFLRVHPVHYPVISDLVGIAARNYAPRKLPSAYLVGPDGRVAFIYYGYGKGYGEDVEERVRAVLDYDTAQRQNKAQGKPAKE